MIKTSIKTSLLAIFPLLIFLLIAPTAHTLDPTVTYYLYEGGNLAASTCLWHEPLDNHSTSLTLSNVPKCRVFLFRTDGTIQATTSTTSPKPTGWCMDAGSGHGKDGDLIQLVQCHGRANQTWHETEDGKLQSINGQCLTRGEGQQVVLGPCQKGIQWRPQIWRPD
jgi:hypothetical protein